VASDKLMCFGIYHLMKVIVGNKGPSWDDMKQVNKFKNVKWV
jgi:hypothetical protein